MFWKTSFRVQFKVVCVLFSMEKYLCGYIISLTTKVIPALLSNNAFSVKGMNGISTWCQLITPKEAASLQDGFFRVSPQMTLGPLLSDNLVINYFNVGGMFHYNCACKLERVWGGSLILCFGSQVLECLEEKRKNWFCHLTLQGNTWASPKLLGLLWPTVPLRVLLTHLNLNKETLLMRVFVPVLTSYF